MKERQRRALAPCWFEAIAHTSPQGQTTGAVLEDYPELEQDDIRACLAYARAAIADESIEAARVKTA